MSSVLAYLREFNFLSSVVRLALALAVGGIIGYGRSKKQRSAGLRTYMLTTVGAALTILIAMYEYEMLSTKWSDVVDLVGLKYDGSRYSAQVITGVGFLAAGTIIGTAHQQVSGLTTAIGLFASACLGIAAGTIIVTHQHSIKGLTTAAGLWASGIIGLAIGAGYYEGGLIATVLILITEVFFSHLSSNIKSMPEFDLTLRYEHKMALDQVMRYCKDKRLAITDLRVNRGGDNQALVYTAVVTLRPRKAVDRDTLLEHIRGIPEILEANYL